MTSGPAARNRMTGRLFIQRGMNVILTSWATNEPDAMNRPKHIRQRWRASLRVPRRPPAKIILISPIAASRMMVARKKCIPAGTPSR